MNRNLLSGITVILVLASAFALFAPLKASAQEVKRNNSFVEEMDTSGPIAAANPFTDLSPTPSLSMYEGLGYYDEVTAKLKGWLAENWYWVDDTTFEINLRPQAHFRDGSPVTAQDARFSIKALNNPTYGSPATPSAMSMIKTINIVDQNALQLIVKENFAKDRRVYSILDANNDIYIIPKDRWSGILEEFGENIVGAKPNLSNPEEINGSGPYTLMKGTVNPEHFYYKKVNDYWGNEIGWYFLPKYYGTWHYDSSSSALASLKQNEVDYAGHGFGITNVRWIQDHEFVTAWNLGAAERESLMHYETGFSAFVSNLDKLDMVRKHRWLRKALMYALNRSKLQEVETGFPVQIPTLLPVGTPRKFIDEEAIENNFETEFKQGVLTIASDPDLAIEILEDYCEGSVDEGWWYPNKENGEKIGGWKMLSVQGWSTPMSLAKVAAKSWDDIGIETKPSYVTYGEWDASIRVRRDWDWTWVWFPNYVSVQPEARTYYNNYLSLPPGQWAGDLVNYPKYFSENYPNTENTADEVKSLVESLWTLDRSSEEYINTLHRIQEIVVPQLPFLPDRSTGGCRIFYNTKRWVGWPYKDDASESVLRGAAPETYLQLKHVYPRSVKTVDFSLSSQEVGPGESVTAKVSLNNTGDADHRYAVYVRKGSPEPGPGPDILSHKAVSVPAGETVTAELELTVPDSEGSYTLTVDDWRVDEYDPGEPKSVVLTVEAGAAPGPSISVESLMLSKYLANPEDTVTISAEVTNTGEGAGTKTVKLLVNGEEEDSQDVSLGLGESTTVEFTVSKAEEGSYTIEVGELSKTLTVRKRVEIPAGLKESVDLAIRVAENAQYAANSAQSTAQKAVDASNEAKTAAQDAKTVAQDAKTAAQDAKTAAQEAKAAAEEAGGVSASMLVASMIVTIIVVLAGVYAITRQQAT